MWLLSLFLGVYHEIKTKAPGHTAEDPSAIYGKSRNSVFYAVVYNVAGVKMKGPADDFEDFDEMGSPQSSLQMPSSSSLESQQREETEGASAEAMAEDERDAENAVNLKEEAQVRLGTHSCPCLPWCRNLELESVP